jgi:glutamyl/glutaminyl-tRNA synthetase
VVIACVPHHDASGSTQGYRGRLAPSPTGYLHLGHARTFWIAQERAQAAGGQLILRNEDLDRSRCRPEFASAMFEDLRWFGFRWEEGPDCGGPVGPYSQSERYAQYREAFERLRRCGFVYPCTCSRRDVQLAAQAPHQSDEELIYPGTCRTKELNSARDLAASPSCRVSWRFRVPDGELISFVDEARGSQSYEAGKDFGDFVIWRQDDVPAYQLAVVVDDAAMGITEIVRGSDLLVSTARQLLIYRALDLLPPHFYHCDLLTDEQGVRLAKRHDSLSLRSLRSQGITPESIRASAAFRGDATLRG